MKITEVRISLKNEDKLKAFANITFDNAFVIRGLKIIEGAQGFFISMPRRKLGDGTFKDIVYPINNDMRCYIETTVLDAFEKEINFE